MRSISHNKLTQIYSLLKEDNDTVSGMGGDFVAEVKTQLDWKQVGLYEPDTPDESKQTEIALKELSTILDTFDSQLNKWREKYFKLGASDTVSKEQLANFIAKSRLGLIKLD
jgi:hypothetical protein